MNPEERVRKSRRTSGDRGVATPQRYKKMYNLGGLRVASKTFSRRSASTAHADAGALLWRFLWLTSFVILLRSLVGDGTSSSTFVGLSNLCRC
jgi:hypothetical protein